MKIINKIGKATVLTCTVAGLLIAVACKQNDTLSYRQYLKWVNDPANGFKVEKTAHAFRLSAKYLSPDFLGSKEFINSNGDKQFSLDSIKATYSNSLCFVFNIAPDDAISVKHDVMYYNVFDDLGFRQRVNEMNFHLNERFFLLVNNEKVYPALHEFENTYSLGGSRNIMLTFFKDSILYACEEYDLVFEDDIFDTGISHFVFPVSKIKNEPEIETD